MPDPLEVDIFENWHLSTPTIPRACFKYASCAHLPHWVLLKKSGTWYWHRGWAARRRASHSERFLESRGIEQRPNLGDHALVV